MTIANPSDSIRSTLVTANDHPLCGPIFVSAGTTPWYEADQFARYHTAQALFGHLQVRKATANDTTVHINAGSAMIDGVRHTYAGGTLDLAANDDDTTYIWAEEDDTDLVIDSAVDGTGWPTTPHIKLAEVTLAGGTFEESAIVDRRPDSIFVIGAAIADLNQDISAAYVEAESQAMSDKIDAILAALRAANIIATS